MFGDEVMKAGKKRLCVCAATTGKMHTHSCTHMNKFELFKELECKEMIFYSTPNYQTCHNPVKSTYALMAERNKTGRRINSLCTLTSE